MLMKMRFVLLCSNGADTIIEYFIELRNCLLYL